MTRLIGDVVVIEVTPPQKCELCGKIAELRPYGPKGEDICFQCGTKDVEGTTARMAAMFAKASVVILNA